MKINNTILAGAIGLVAGLLLGYIFTSSGREAAEQTLAKQEELSQSVAALSEAVSGLEGKLEENVGGLQGAIEDKVQGLENSVTALGEQQTGAVQGLSERLGTVGSDLSGGLSEIGSSMAESVARELEQLRSDLAAFAERGSDEQSQADAASGGAEEPVAEGEQLRVGETVSFGVGAARVFLSSVDESSGTARVAINGPKGSAMTLGEPVTTGDCALMLTGISPGGATISGDCGEAASSDKAPPQGSGEGSEIAIGTAGSFGEGAVRVFISSVDAQSGTARAAINGTEVTILSISEPVEVGNCQVELTGTGDGKATIDAKC